VDALGELDEVGALVNVFDLGALDEVDALVEVGALDEVDALDELVDALGDIVNSINKQLSNHH